jgi:hypothetical protein
MLLSTFVPLLLLAAAPASSPSTRPAASLEANRQRLHTGYYPVLMIGSGGNVDLFRQAHADSRLCTAPPDAERVAMYAREGMPIYIYVFNGDGTLHLPNFWNVDRERFLKEPSPANLVRDPSLFDPQVVAGLKQRVRDFARGYHDTDVLAMCVAHEASMTGFSSPLDFDYSPHALKRFRAWLERRYGEIGNLNASWDMEFDGFASVSPPITDTVIDREYPRYPAMRLAPWYDFREFIDESFVDLVHELAAVIRAEAPHIPTSVTVTAVPSAYGGWDYARLLQPGRIDAVETYPFPGDKGMIRGLTNGQTVNVCSLYPGEGNAAKLRLWRNFLSGERSNVFADKTSALFPHKDRLGGRSEEYQPEFALMRKLAALIGDTQPDSAGVRMIYSQPSIRCHWFIDNKPDAKTYPNRGAKYEIDHNTTIQELAGWQDLLGELGIHPLFESYLDLRAGRFRHGTPAVLIASRTCCLGEAELATLRDYVKGGGTLLVDESFAMFDDHGNARQAERIPLLDTSRPPLRATFGQIDVANTADCEPVVTQIGKGRVVLLNASLVSYGQTPRDAVRRTLRRSIAGYLPSPPVRLLADGQPAFDVDVYRYPLKDGEGYGLCATRPDTQVAATLVSEGSREWVDVASGARLGTGRINVTIPANRALFIQAVGSPSSRPGPG